MPSAMLKKRLTAMQAEVTALHPREPAALQRLRTDPARFLTDAALPADPWQAELLRSPSDRILLLASRQSGKSTVAAALCLKTALLESGSLCLLLSPTLRQSGELFRAKVKTLYNALGRPVPTVQESALTMELANGSRIISLPGEEGTVRGYSGARLLVLDEASRIDDALYHSVRAMLAVSRGGLIALSTPFGKRGFFYEEWHSDRRWQRVRIPADACPRITRDFLREERASIGERWFRQEYFCSFEDVVGAVFSHEDIQAAITDAVQPLFPVAAASVPATAGIGDDVQPLFAEGEL